MSPYIFPFSSSDPFIFIYPVQAFLCVSAVNGFLDSRPLFPQIRMGGSDMRYALDNEFAKLSSNVHNHVSGARQPKLWKALKREIEKQAELLSV